MELAVEISMYPLREDYIPVIEDFIRRLNARSGLRVVTNTMSTQIFGEFDAVTEAVKQEMRASFQKHGKAVFVMKYLSPDAGAKPG